MFLIQVGFYLNIASFDWKPMFFWIPRRKTMQNHLEITSKNQFWNRSVRNWTKSRNLDMSIMPKKPYICHIVVFAKGLGRTISLKLVSAWISGFDFTIECNFKPELYLLQTHHWRSVLVNPMMLIIWAGKGGERWNVDFLRVSLSCDVFVDSCSGSCSQLIVRVWTVFGASSVAGLWS